jgi:membrane protease YdiL (CAAX protease family)
VSSSIRDVTRPSSGGVPVVASGTRSTVRAAVAAIVVMEAAVAFVNPVVGAIGHAVVLLALLLRWVLAGDVTMLVLALVPLGRLTSLALTPDEYGAGGYVLTGLPLLVAVVWMTRDLGWPGVPESGRPAWHSIAVALSGIPLGLVVAALFHVPYLPDRKSLPVILVTAVVVFVFVGVLEELLFRGLVQRAMTGPFGTWAFVVADVLFTAAYLPTRDFGFIATMALVGLGFGYYVSRTGHLAAVATAHGLLAAGAVAVWPVLL